MRWYGVDGVPLKTQPAVHANGLLAYDYKCHQIITTQHSRKGDGQIQHRAVCESDSEAVVKRHEEDRLRGELAYMSGEMARCHAYQGCMWRALMINISSGVQRHVGRYDIANSLLVQLVRIHAGLVLCALILRMSEPERQLHPTPEAF